MENIQINDWRKSIGISLVQRPAEDTLEKCIQVDGGTLNSMPMRELDESIVALSNYYLFLKATIGDLASRVQYINDLLDRKCSEAAAKMSGGHFLERKALALSKDTSLDKMNDKLNEYRAKIQILEPVTDGIKMKLDVVRRIYDRRAREKQ